MNTSRKKYIGNRAFPLGVGKAFSLLEVIAVFVIITILLSVAATTAIWLDNRVDSAEAESSLTTVLSAQREASFSFSAWERDFDKLNLPKGPTVSLEESNSPDVVSSYIDAEGDLFLATKSSENECIACVFLTLLKAVM